MQIIKETHIDFLGKWKWTIGLSVVLCAAGAVSILSKGGLNYGLDFTGGTLLQLETEPAIPIKSVRDALQTHGFPNAQIQTVTGKNAFLVRVKGSQENVEAVASQITEALRKTFPQNTFQEVRREYVGPAVGDYLIRQALKAFAFSLLAIIIYVAFRFKNPVWGMAGVIALIHDVWITLAAFSWTNREVDLVIVAALLTIAGYSINDTIVIFDRMRENMRKNVKMPFGEMTNLSLNETLSRTLITNLTVFFAVVALLLFGGDVLHNFAFAMFCGCIAGTYSTIGIAAPLAYLWETRHSERSTYAENQKLQDQPAPAGNSTQSKKRKIKY